MNGEKYELVTWWSEEKAAYVVEVPELPGCLAHGPTRQDAIRNAEEAIRFWMKTAQEDGLEIPQPRRRLNTISPQEQLASFANSTDFRRVANQFHAKQKFRLVVGAGCSMEIGTPSFESLKRKALIELSSNLFQSKPIVLPQVNLDDFDAAWSQTGRSTRQAILANWLFPRPAYLGSYHDLALLVQGGFFTGIISYNFDDYLETALHSVGVDDFVPLINGVHDNAFVAETLRSATSFTIMKTHGDHLHRVYAMTQKEIALCGENWAAFLRPLLEEKLLIIGYSASDVDFLRSLPFSHTGDEIWFVNPQPPPPHLATAMEIRNSGNNWIKSTFGGFTNALYYELLKGGIVSKLQRQRQRLGSQKVSREIVVTNKLGIHARPAAMIVRTINRFDCAVLFEKDGETVNGKSQMGLMMLAAGPGARIIIHAEGEDADICVLELQNLFERKFDED